MAKSSLHTVLILTSFIVCFVATIIHIVAFATSNWLVSDGSSPFVRLGWHEACFSNCHFPYCPGGDRDIVYNGCYVWTFNEMIMIDERFREIKDWLMPAWFNTARIVFIINIPLSMVCTIFLLACTCWACANQYTTASTRRKDITSMALLYVTLGLLIVSTLLNVVGIAIFSSNAPLRNYMPMPYKNHFGYSFWLDFAVCIMLGICCITCFLAAVAKTMHFRGPKDVRYSEDMMLGRV